MGAALAQGETLPRAVPSAAVCPWSAKLASLSASRCPLTRPVQPAGAAIAASSSASTPTRRVPQLGDLAHQCGSAHNVERQQPLRRPAATKAPMESESPQCSLLQWMAAMKLRKSLYSSGFKINMSLLQFDVKMR